MSYSTRAHYQVTTLQVIPWVAMIILSFSMVLVAVVECIRWTSIHRMCINQNHEHMTKKQASMIKMNTRLGRPLPRSQECRGAGVSRDSWQTGKFFTNSAIHARPPYVNASSKNQEYARPPLDTFFSSYLSLY